MLGFPILYCKGMRPMMFQLSSFCYSPKDPMSVPVPKWEFPKLGDPNIVP